ncbi:hypothetical protein BH10ACI2_BH10ACI2_19680 [soil metagenome]
MSKSGSALFFGISLAAIFFFCVAAAIGQPVCKGKDLFFSHTCAGDTSSANESALFDLINNYRVENGQPELRPSTSLSMVANRRLLDLQQNMKTLTHSWSNCPYDIDDQSTWPCVTDAPKRLNAGYNGQGYETLYRVTSGQVLPSLALEAWKKSTLHNSIILNQGIFKDMQWNELGVAIDGQYAVMWFGYPGESKTGVHKSDGLGVSYDQTISGLSKILSIEQKYSSIENNKWEGFSADKK